MVIYKNLTDMHDQQNIKYFSLCLGWNDILSVNK